MILPYIILVLMLIYGGLIFFYWVAWKAIPDYTPSATAVQVKISIIIPARNEEKNIGALLLALQAQTYPADLFEVIVIDDDSTDNTFGIVQQFPDVKLIRLQNTGINSYKKKAIEAGIQAAAGDLIVTTDADCIPGKNWLVTLAAFKTEKQSAFIAAPVVFEYNNSLLQLFQSLDFLVLQGITGAAVYKNMHSMCNGANLAYEKNAFTTVNGFAGIDRIASGDDMLLMHKIWQQYPGKVHYLKAKEAIVTTQPMKTWKAFFNQRIRWASKAKSYDDKRIMITLLLVYLFNLSFLVLAIAGFFYPSCWIWLAGYWLAKTLIEFPFVYSVAVFFNKKSLMNYFLFFQPIHILYTIVSGFLGQLGTYEWKGRRVR